MMSSGTGYLLMRYRVSMMDSVSLRFFEAVARLGAMNRAADALNTVQSNVTARMKSLEEEALPRTFASSSLDLSCTEVPESAAVQKPRGRATCHSHRNRRRIAVAHAGIAAAHHHAQ